MTTAFAAALVQSHVATFAADLYRGGSLVASNLPIVGGSVSVDASANVRRSCSLTLVDAAGTLTPSGPGDAVAPYGNELLLYRGIAGSDITRSPLGVFRIGAAKAADNGSRTVQLNGFDRSRAVARARKESPYTIASGTNYVTAIQSLIDSCLPGLTYNLITTTATTPLIVIDENADPWDQATQMAQSIGCELFFDVTGVVVLRPEPDPANLALKATYAEGPNAVITALTNNLTDETGYNVFVVIGEPPNAAPVRSVAYDDNPSSATYYLGPYGKVTTFLRTPLVTTQAQADAAAAAGLLRKMGGTEQLQIEAIPDPTLEAGSLIRVVRAAMGIDDFYVVDSFSIPLSVNDEMSITTRKRQL